MSVKLSKEQQMQLIEELRYGRDWAQIKQSLAKYEYTYNSKQNSIIKHPQCITYELLGRKNESFTTSQKKMQKKISQYLPLCEEQPNSLQLKRKRSKPQPYKDIDYDYFYEKEQRYYNNEIYCKNCSEYGHSIQFCPIQKKCMYCLCATHQGQKCGHKNICFECYELKHTTQNCSGGEQKQRIFCNNCQRKHMKLNVKDYCYSLTKNREEKKQLFPTDQFYNCVEILCMRCRRNGHLFC